MDVTIVGSGPNGLTAAIICARAGLKVQVVEAQSTFGGGARTATDPEYAGVLHDVCSAVHPLALASPFFTQFDLPARGVRLAVPEISYANPLPGRPAAIAYRDLDRTCAELEHGASFRRLLGPLVERSGDVVALLLGDKRSMPKSVPSAASLGLRMLAQGTPAWGSLAGEDARALFTGVAAHIISRMPSLTASGAGLMLGTLAHSAGWPIPVGGSQAITDATAVVERFAPGFRDVVVAARAVPAARLSDHNANYVGGDIGMGGNSAWRAIAGPTPQLNPWRTPIPKVYLCSAATPPGGGVHGMAGYYAARTLLRREFGITKLLHLGPTMTS